MKSKELNADARTAFEETLATARERLIARDYASAWSALERAHVLSQPDAWLHVRSHWWMLRCGIAQGDMREVIGQIVRVVLAAPATWLGRYPVGNTGRARVGLFQPMAIVPEVARLLSEQRM